MRKTLRILAIGLAILASLAALLVIALYIWVSNPKYERQALPAELISLESAAGKNYSPNPKRKPITSRCLGIIKPKKNKAGVA